MKLHGGTLTAQFTTVIALIGIAGCAREKSFPIVPQKVITLAADESAAPTSTRDWLKTAQSQLSHLYPGAPAAPLLTSDLTAADGDAVDVCSHFGITQKKLSSIWSNWNGILCSAQVSGERFGPQPPEWPGFEDILIPVSTELQLSGRLGLAQRNGRPAYADCIVLLAGLFGDNSTIRSRDLALALRAAGLHVLSLEQRGHGQTEARNPNVPYSFGAMEAGDLLIVARWLEARPEVRDTGLIGFCWGANTSLLTAWEEGRRDDDPAVPEGIRPYLKNQHDGSVRPTFRAGVIAFSPALRFELLLDRLEHRWSVFSDPVCAALGDIVDARVKQKHYRELNGDLRALLHLEAERAAPRDPDFYENGVRYVHLMPDANASTTKLDAARMPVLVVHAADDPVGAAQPVADLMCRVHNPNVAAIILPSGGHCGFPSRARDYYYSLILNFFDSRQGAAATQRERFAVAP